MNSSQPSISIYSSFHFSLLTFNKLHYFTNLYKHTGTRTNTKHSSDHLFKLNIRKTFSCTLNSDFLHLHLSTSIPCCSLVFNQSSTNEACCNCTTFLKLQHSSHEKMIHACSTAFQVTTKLS